MTKTAYYTLWAGMFILCAGLGFIPEPEGFLKFFMTACSVAFFVPPAILTWFAGKQGDDITLKLIRNLAATSLGLTVVILAANFMSLMAPEAVGNILYVLLLIVSTPMVCSGRWVLSLFLWACLLIAALRLLRKK